MRGSFFTQAMMSSSTSYLRVLLSMAAVAIVTTRPPYHPDYRPPDTAPVVRWAKSMNHPVTRFPSKARHLSMTKPVSHSFTKWRPCYPHNLCSCSRLVADCSKNYGRLTFIPKLPKTIQRLLFSFNNLTRISEETFFSNVTEIVSVDLSNNGLTYIHPDAFKRLQKLQTLVLDYNRLTYPALVPAFSSPSLNDLSIGHMSLGSVPGDLFSHRPVPPLRALNFTGNPVQSLNLSVFAPLDHLSSLTVARCRITSISGSLLPQLKHLDLQTNALFDFPRSCGALGSSLLPSLKTLNFA
ncbi:hypothetical protein ACOMHN_031036 [Nucella lapillus]